MIQIFGRVGDNMLCLGGVGKDPVMKNLFPGTPFYVTVR